MICRGLTVGKSVRCWVSGDPKSLLNLMEERETDTQVEEVVVSRKGIKSEWEQ